MSLSRHRPKAEYLPESSSELLRGHHHGFADQLPVVVVQPEVESESVTALNRKPDV